MLGSVPPEAVQQAEELVGLRAGWTLGFIIMSSSTCLQRSAVGAVERWCGGGAMAQVGTGHACKAGAAAASARSSASTANHQVQPAQAVPVPMQQAQQPPTCISCLSTGMLGSPMLSKASKKRE